MMQFKFRLSNGDDGTHFQPVSPGTHSCTRLFTLRATEIVLPEKSQRALERKSAILNKCGNKRKCNQGGEIISHKDGLFFLMIKHFLSHINTCNHICSINTIILQKLWSKHLQQTSVTQSKQEKNRDGSQR